jgi:hypothetical protein
MKNKTICAALFVAATTAVAGFSTAAKADCFDTAYSKYINFQNTTYSLTSKRNADLQILYSSGAFAAESGSVFRSGERGGTSWTGYNMFSLFPTSSTTLMYVRLNFTTPRTVQISVPAWSYNATTTATCSGDVIQVYDGQNTFLLSLYGYNGPR